MFGTILWFTALRAFTTTASAAATVVSILVFGFLLALLVLLLGFVCKAKTTSQNI